MAADTTLTDDLGPSPRAHGETRAVISLVSVAHFYSHLFFMLLPPLYPILTGALSVDYTQLAWLLVVFNVVTGLTQAPLGVLVDRIGAGKLLIAAVAIQGVALAGIAVFPTYPLMMIAMGIAGVANAIYHPADYAILSHRIPSDAMGRAFAVHTFSGFMGGAVAPSAVIALTTLWGWQAALGFIGVTGLVMAAVLFASRSALIEPEADQEADAQKSKAPLSWREWFAIMSSRPILLTLVFWILISASSNGVTYFAVSALTEAFATPLVAANIALTAYLVGGSMGILAGGLIGDRTTHHQWVVVFGCAGAGIGTIAAGLTQLPTVVLAGVLFIAGIAWGIPTPSRDLLARAVAPKGATGAVFGFVSTGFNIGGVIGPLVFAYFLDHHMPEWVFPVSGALMIVTGLLVLAIPERKPVNPSAAS
ncbi:MAG: MFS transporter [Rhodobacteraceae bacterium]|nr:MFS transporter [Paracoccaceae bacterium]